jgi:opacity protein-like surface antigen
MDKELLMNFPRRLLLFSFYLVLSVTSMAYATSAKPPSSGKDDNGRSIYFGLGNTLSFFDVTRNNFSVVRDNSNELAGSEQIKGSFKVALSPSIQFGYWGKLSSGDFWGAKLSYSSFNNFLSEQYDVLSGDDSIGTNEYMVVSHQILASLLFGRRIDQIFVYVGGGFAWLPDVKDRMQFNGADDSGAVAAKFEKHKNLFGGVGQLGITYQLNSKWFFDLSYQYVAMAKTNLTETEPWLNTTGAVIGKVTYDRDINMNMQQFAITINHRFSI